MQHTERNHNIRIPGFAADDMRMSLSAQTGAAPPAAKKAGGGMTMTLRSHRLSQVAQAKRDGKLL
jgi:transcription initiation factor TFIID subunit 12